MLSIRIIIKIEVYVYNKFLLQEILHPIDYKLMKILKLLNSNN